MLWLARTLEPTPRRMMILAPSLRAALEVAGDFFGDDTPTSMVQIAENVYVHRDCPPIDGACPGEHGVVTAWDKAAKAS